MALEAARIYVTVILILLTFALITHIIAMGYPRWKVIESTRSDAGTIYIGLFHRCEDILKDRGESITNTKPYLICDYNYYLPRDSEANNSTSELCSSSGNTDQTCQGLCNLRGNPEKCDYMSQTKGLIACTCIAACTIGLALLITYTNLLINQFKYKTHLKVSFVALIFSILGFLAILTTLILIGSYMERDLWEYKENLINQVKTYKAQCDQRDCSITPEDFEKNKKTKLRADWDVRLDFSAGLEIVSLIMTSFALITQILYLFRTLRSKTG